MIPFIAIILLLALMCYSIMSPTQPVASSGPAPEPVRAPPPPKFIGDVSEADKAAWVNRIHDMRNGQSSRVRPLTDVVDINVNIPQRTAQCAFEWASVFDKRTDPFLRKIARMYYINSNFTYREFLEDAKRIMDEKWGAEAA